MNTKKGSILIYTVILANLAIVIAWILFSKSQILTDNIEYQNLNLKALKNVQEKGILSIRYDRTLNANGGGFTGALNCPSGSSFNISSGSLICTNWAWLTLYFSPTKDNFFRGVLNGIYATPVGNSIDFNGTVVTWDGSRSSYYDGNLNSDNYTPFSTGNVAYPDNYYDDDVLARTTAYGYVKRGIGWYSAFWNNTYTNAYVEKNTNNTGSLFSFIGQTGTGFIHLDVDAPFNLRILEFNSGSYVTNNTLQKLSDTSYSFTWWVVWWLGKTGAIYGGNSPAGSGSLLQAFNFKEKNYAILLSYALSGSTASGNDFLKFKISAKDDSNRDLYIVPLNDSFPDFIKYLWNDILITSDNNFISKQYEVIEPKILKSN